MFCDALNIFISGNSLLVLSRIAVSMLPPGMSCNFSRERLLITEWISLYVNF